MCKEVTQETSQIKPIPKQATTLIKLLYSTGIFRTGFYRDKDTQSIG
jgi:hypothetical protein